MQYRIRNECLPQMRWISPAVGGGVVGVVGVLTVKGVSTESKLTSPLVLTAATNTLYSALGIKPLKVMLVSFVYTVALKSLLSWYLTL